MKSKLSLCCACLCGYAILCEPCHAVPGSAYRDAENYNTSNYTTYNKPSYLYKSSQQQNYDNQSDSDVDVRFVMEYQIDLFTSAKTTLTLSDDYIKLSGKAKTTEMNTGGRVLLGIAFSELNAQIGVTAGRSDINDAESTTFGIGLRLPMSKGALQPYIEADVLYSSIDVDWVEDDVSAIGFGLEGGLLYNLTKNTYIKGGLAYGYTKFEEEESGIKGTLKITSWTLNTGLGYRF